MNLLTTTDSSNLYTCTPSTSEFLSFLLHEQLCTRLVSPQTKQLNTVAILATSHTQITF